VRIFAVLWSIQISKLNIRKLFAWEESVSKHLLTNLRLLNVSVRTINWISFFNSEQVSLSRICLKNSFINYANQVFNTFLHVGVLQNILCLESLRFSIVNYSEDCIAFLKFLSISFVPFTKKFYLSSSFVFNLPLHHEVCVSFVS
jgi:hypothetical protein